VRHAIDVHSDAADSQRDPSAQPVIGDARSDRASASGLSRKPIVGGVGAAAGVAAGTGVAW
jgi:hypothetical protein